MIDQQPAEAFRGGTETLQRLAEMDRVLDIVREVSNYNLLFTIIVVILCVIKMWMIIRNGHRIAAMEKAFDENNDRGRTFYSIGHRVQENQEHFRESIQKALDSLESMHRRLNILEFRAQTPASNHFSPPNGHENKAANTVNINHPGELKTPEQSREIFWDYLVTQQNNANNRIRELEKQLIQHTPAPKTRRKKNLPPTEENPPNI